MPLLERKDVEQMTVGMESYLTSYLSPYSVGGGSTTSTSSIFDYAAAQRTAAQDAADLQSEYTKNKESVSTLTKDTANFLDSYTKSLSELSQAANSLRLDNLDDTLYDQNGQITEESVKNTVDATQDFVDQYNSTLKLLNDNADRGPGVMKQLARMVQDPAPESSMDMIGLSMNDDGTLQLDQEKMTTALKDSSAGSQKLYRDILGGFGGVADTTYKYAQYGLNTSARDLVMNDLSNIKSVENENPFVELYDSFRSSAYSMNNMAVGAMMNLLV